MLMVRVPERVPVRPLEPLTLSQRIALECLKQIASEGREATQEEITAGIGSRNESGSSATGVINGLVRKGYIEHVAGHPLQRAIWVRIVATNQCTAEPRCKAAHWRYRTDRVPAPTIQRVSEYAKPLAQLIEAKARSLGKPLAEFLIDCVYVGFHEISREER